MAVQRSLGWATTKKSITMTGQKRMNSLLASFDTLSPPGSRKNSNSDSYSPTNSRKNSTENHDIGENIPIEEENTYVKDLLKYSARKFSVYYPMTKKDTDRTILDDAEYFMSKKECDYGMCECCPVEKRLQTNWESIEEIIENDPEIIFDCDDNPIVVEPVKETQESIYSGTTLVGSVSKKLKFDKLPALFKTLYSKISDSSIS